METSDRFRYRRCTINCAPQLLADGRYSPRLVITVHEGDAAVDHSVDVGAQVYRTPQEASQVAVSAGMHWVDGKIGPLYKHGEFAYEASATTYGDGQWTGDVRIYGSSPEAGVLGRRTNYLQADGVFATDGQAKAAARKHAEDLIDSGAPLAWEDE